MATNMITNKPTHIDPIADDRWTGRLRAVLRLNAATSLGGGLVAAIASPWVSDTLGIDHVLITRLLGVGLVLFAADVAFLSTRGREALARGARLVSAADIAWVLASLVVVATGILTTVGVAVTLLVALGVADFAATQLWFRARLQRH